MYLRMTSMSDPNLLPAPTPPLLTFPRRVFLLLLLVALTATAFYILFDWKPDTHPLARHFLADMTIGLAAGLGARGLLRKQNRFVRVISATASLVIGLVILGALSGWRTGLGPLSFWRDTIDWAGLAQMLTGGTGVFLALQAWSKPAGRGMVPQVAVTTPAASPQSPDQVAAKPKRKRKKAANTSQPRSISAPAEPAAIPAEPARDISISKLPDRPVITREQNKTAAQLVVRKPKVRLSKVENHLCPYCLEPVLQNDPRGVVECEICHTQHHGDCWAIAGFCQVPHFTA